MTFTCRSRDLLRTPIGRLRVIAFIEGISFLLLLGVAMPLKYFAGMPEAVKTTGWIHGVLFMLYLFAVAEVTVRRRLSFALAFGALVASLIPFGTFVLDAHLRRGECPSP
jgi:integral membrane protein